MAPLATAFVRVEGDEKPFLRSVDKAGRDGASSLHRDMSHAGRSSGKSFGDLFYRTGLGPIRALGAAAAGIFVGVKTISFLKDSIAQARESNRVAALTAQVIKTTGSAAHISAGQVSSLATAISNKTGIDDEAIQSGANLLLTFTNVRNEVGKGNDIFNQATQTITDMSAALGQDTSSSAIQLGKALNDPIKGVTALSRVGVSFTEDQMKQIKVLQESGDTMGAQKVILGELSKEFGGAGEASTNAGAKMKTSFDNMKESIGTALLPALDTLEGVLTGLFTTVGPKLVGAFDAMGGAISDFIHGYTVGIDGISDPQTIAAQAGAIAYTYATKLRDGFKDAVTIIGPALKDVAAAIASTVLPEAKDMLTRAITFITDLASAIQTGVNTGDWSGVGKAVSDALVASVTHSADLLTRLTEAFGHLMREIDWVGLGIEIGKYTVPFVVGVAAGIINYIGSPQMFEDLWHHFWDLLAAVIAVAFLPGRVVTRVAEVLAKIPFAGKLLSWAFEEFAKFSKGLVRLVLRALGALGDAFLRGLGVQRKVVTAGFRAFFDDVVLVIVEYAKIFARRGLELIRGLGRGITSGFEGLGKVVGRIGGIVLRGVSGAASWLVKTGRDVIGGLVRSLGQQIGGTSIGRTVGRVKNVVVGAFADAGRWLYEAGKRIIQGLIDGIGSMFGAVEKKAKDLGNKIVGWKGPPDHDSVMLVDNGRRIIKGLVHGFSLEEGGVRRKLADITDTIGMRLGGAGYINARLNQPATPAARGQSRADDLLAEVADLLRENNALLAQQPAANGAHLTASLNGLALASAHNSRGTVPVY